MSDLVGIKNDNAVRYDEQAYILSNDYRDSEFKTREPAGISYVGKGMILRQRFHCWGARVSSLRTANTL